MENYNNLLIKYNNLKKEFEENTVINSMNEMKHMYNNLDLKYKALVNKNSYLELKNKELTKKIEKYNEIIYDITNRLKSITLTTLTISDKSDDHNLKIKLSLVLDMLNECIKIKNDIYLL